MKGKFFVIEGTDGAGKGTQFALLNDRLVSEGYDVVTFDFPQYNQDSSYFVRQYLAGNYGTQEQVGPYTASAFYAFDRYSAKQNIQKAIDEGKIVIANRFTGSNMAHQGTKFVHPEERRGYFIWLDNFEFQMLGIPRPTMSYVLRVDAKTSMKLIEERASEQADRQKDIHEQDEAHLQKSVQVYDDLCALFPKDFERIDCVRSNKLLTREQIQELLWAKIEKELPKPHHEKGKKGKSVNGSDLHQDYVFKDEKDIYSITEAGKNFLKSAVTSVDSNVYAFTDAMSPITIAAAMARLSRRGDDMRITLLDEFGSATAKKDDKLLRRVITAYGDDSVQQLVGQHLVVEGASNLLTKKLEWGRLAAYLEQSTRYIYFDQKDAEGNYRYYTPKLSPTLTKTYKLSMDALFDTYSDMVRKLTSYVRQNSTVPKNEQDVAWQGATRAQACDAIRPVLPVATKATVGIFASGQALESLIMHLLSDELLEARETGQKILEECRKVVSTFLERADKPDRGGATIAYTASTRSAVRSLAEKHLSTSNSKIQDVDLVSFWPRNELDIIPDILYEHTNLSLKDIKKQVEDLSYNDKAEILQSAFGERLNRRHKPGRALEKIHYSWDLVCDYGIFRDLQRHRMVDDLNWQQLTPDYGYDIPDLVEEAGLTEQFKKCFEISDSLHRLMQASGEGLNAQYATLLGHKMRWKITYNARQAFHFHELRTTPHGHPGYRKLVGQMHEKLREVHPMIGEAMKFVNQDEDPELTRLSAERYTQFKLSQLD